MPSHEKDKPGSKRRRNSDGTDETETPCFRHIRHVVTGDLEFTFTGCVTDRRPIHEMSLHPRDRRVEVERSATHNTRRDQVLHDFLLSVER